MANSCGNSIVIALIVLCGLSDKLARPPSAAAASREVFLAEIDPKIIGGSAIGILEAPWQVSVRLAEYDYPFGNGHICGGSVISQRVVVSAAHCVAVESSASPVVYRTASEFSLVMGSKYLYEVTQYTLQYSVLQVVVHPAFDLATLVNDVSLFFMNGYIPFGYPTVAAVPLNTAAVLNGTMCTVSGWGKTGSGYISSVLMEATLPIVSNVVCSTNYGNISAGDLCAGYMQTGGVDSCQGDSGGPLICNSLLTGIVSWGDGCAQPGYPGVYTNESYFHDWITATNASFNYDLYRNTAGSLATASALRSVAVGLIASLLTALVRRPHS